MLDQSNVTAAYYCSTVAAQHLLRGFVAVSIVFGYTPLTSTLSRSLLQEVAWGHHRALADAPTFDDMVEAVESGNISVIGLSETLKKHAFVLNDDWQLHRR